MTKKRSREESEEEHEEEENLEGGHMGDSARLYICTFCRRGFTSAQALGGHMNVHRKARAALKQTGQQQQQQITEQGSSSAHQKSGYNMAGAYGYSAPVIGSSSPSVMLQTVLSTRWDSNKAHRIDEVQRTQMNLVKDPEDVSELNLMGRSGEDLRLSSVNKEEEEEEEDEDKDDGLDLELRLGDKK